MDTEKQLAAKKLKRYQKKHSYYDLKLENHHNLENRAKKAAAKQVGERTREGL